MAMLPKVVVVVIAPEMGSKSRKLVVVTINARPSARKAAPSGVSPVEKV